MPLAYDAARWRGASSPTSTETLVSLILTFPRHLAVLRGTAPDSSRPAGIGCAGSNPDSLMSLNEALRPAGPAPPRSGLIQIVLPGGATAHMDARMDERALRQVPACHAADGTAAGRARLAGPPPDRHSQSARPREGGGFEPGKRGSEVIGIRSAPPLRPAPVLIRPSGVVWTGPLMALLHFVPGLGRAISSRVLAGICV